MNKLILVHYLNTNGLSSNNAKEQFFNYKKMVNEEYPDFTHFIMPIQNGDNKIECINPQLISHEEYTIVSEFIKSTDEKINEFLNKVKI